MKVEIKKQKQPKLIQLDVRKIEDIPLASSDDIKVLLEDYVRRMAKAGLKVVGSPYASVERKSKKKFDLIIRAAVVPVPKRSRGTSVKTKTS